jgi:DNA-binding beta-propeller fold protein YncE
MRARWQARHFPTPPPIAGQIPQPVGDKPHAIDRDAANAAVRGGTWLAPVSVQRRRCGARSRRIMLCRTTVLLLLCALFAGAPACAEVGTFESGQVRPLALSADGKRLYAVDTPDARLEIFAVGARSLTPLASVPVGLEPVAVAVRDDGEVWVVNHLSDSISIVDVASTPPRVRRTLLVGDEPRDLVFAGPARGRAFVTAAHRGQNRPGDPQLTTPGVGRADVWVFDTANLGAPLGGTPEAILTLFTDTPRALAVSPDGATVYAAGFHSGNRTTAIHEGLVCDGGAAAPPCDVSGHRMPGGLPAPNANRDGVPQPEVGLIVKYDGTRWRDGEGRDWSNAVRFTLPDRDVFAIDATADPPIARPFASGVGTILFAMVVDPATGRLLVANTEARNEVRFEGPGTTAGSTVRGHLHEARVTIVERDGRARSRRLNPHIDYARVPSPTGVAERSLATPVAIAISSDGATTYVAAYGSSKIGVLDTRALVDGTFVPDASRHVVLRGGGPSGLALDETHGRLYVATRFDDGISIVDTRARREIAHVVMHAPESATVKRGRRLLYDARFTSSNGEASCAGCHVFGDTDSLGWDLGNPDAPVVENRNPRHPGLQQSADFHPMKGPMTTQTLRGLAGQGPLHWRGDRTGGRAAPSTMPDAGAYDVRAGVREFNAAFVGLLGRTAPLGDGDMAALADFVLQIRQPPNPIRNLDGSLTSDQEAGRKFFLTSDPSDVSGPCVFCHVLDPSRGQYGTDGHSVIVPEGPMKIPGLRGAYQKVGMFGMPHVPGRLAQFGFNATDHRPQGDQVRGFGFTHDGSVDTIFRFLQTRGFNFSRANRGGFTLDAAGDAQRRQVEQYVLAFDGDLAPIVGQQVTLAARTPVDADVDARIMLLVARADVGECDLVVKGVLDGAARGWLYDPGRRVFRSDRAAEPAIAAALLRARADQERTFTCVPPGSGARIGIDRDEDGVLDRDELDAGSDPANAATARRPGRRAP